LADTPPDFTPVTLITGFLGSGKTTLLQRLLLDPALSDTAVLINEFGDIGLDHHLLERIDETMVMLQSGCVCCTIRGELSTAIKDLHSRRERVYYPEVERLLRSTLGASRVFLFDHGVRNAGRPDSGVPTRPRVAQAMPRLRVPRGLDQRRLTPRRDHRASRLQAAPPNAAT
jgi:CobW/HypB/UreG, nucleotide-binding domain